ncbi:MAG: hypothetical protein WA821_21655 [Anaerolineales bacterium]
MKPKSARYFGMTNSQLGILAGAAAVVLLVIGGLSWFVFAPPSPEQPAAVATEIPPTPSPYFTQVIVVTSPPTPSPEIATSVPPDGWVEFQTQGARLWLPSNFVGGDLLTNRAESINSITRLGGARFKNTVKAMKQTPSQLVMWMVDKTVSNDPIIMTILITHEVKEEGISIEQYLQDNITSVSATLSTTVYETKKITLLGREARRMAYRQQIQAGYEIAGVAYYIKDENDFWVVDYMLDPNKYTDMLSMVEQSIHTFDLVKE